MAPRRFVSTAWDNYWFGARRQILLDGRGPDVDAMIDNIRAAIDFTGNICGERVAVGTGPSAILVRIRIAGPELGLSLPANAVGKDFLPGGALLATAPRGYQCYIGDSGKLPSSTWRATSTIRF
jgi:hypothetical protein